MTQGAQPDRLGVAEAAVPALTPLFRVPWPARFFFTVFAGFAAWSADLPMPEALLFFFFLLDLLVIAGLIRDERRFADGIPREFISPHPYSADRIAWLAICMALFIPLHFLIAGAFAAGVTVPDVSMARSQVLLGYIIEIYEKTGSTEKRWRLAIHFAANMLAGRGCQAVRRFLGHPLRSI